MSPGARADLSERLVAALRAHHETHPLADGMPREEARERLFGRVAPGVFEQSSMGSSPRAGSSRATGSRSRARESRFQRPRPRRRGRSSRFIEAGLTPPDLATAAAAVGTAVPVAERMILLLVRARTLVQVDALVFHGDALERLKADIRRMKNETGAARVDVGSFKERFGVTRKYAIPLLEYLDRERVTRRMGESRIVL